jgi:hypothetical protein
LPELVSPDIVSLYFIPTGCNGMINSTSLNKQVITKILKACQEALSNDSGQAYCINKKGKPFIRVKRILTTKGLVGFQILYKSVIDIAGLVRNTMITHDQAKKITGMQYPQGLIEFLLKRVAYPHQVR